MTFGSVVDLLFVASEMPIGSQVGLKRCSSEDFARRWRLQSVSTLISWWGATVQHLDDVYQFSLSSQTYMEHLLNCSMIVLLQVF